ncbi:MAG: helix-turn-helix domain-containing protein [Verrucomicrobiae bacterium]|nr:helix-turn-helix domain-containing protein [Verrucomicrobiae bacterium]
MVLRITEKRQMDFSDLQAIDLNILAKAFPLVAYDELSRFLGVSPTTLWRWRRRGAFSVVQIFGKMFVRHEEIQRLVRRAIDGKLMPQPRKKRRIRREVSSAANPIPSVKDGSILIANGKNGAKSVSLTTKSPTTERMP